MRFIKVSVLVIVTSFLVIACGSGGGGGSGEEDTLTNITGTWYGTFSYQSCINSSCYSETITVTFTIVQSGNTVTGTFSTSTGGTGSISGTVEGNTFNFTLSETHPCIATLNGTGTISGNTIDYNLSGIVCNESISGSGTVTKEQH